MSARGGLEVSEKEGGLKWLSVSEVPGAERGSSVSTAIKKGRVVGVHNNICFDF